MRGDIFFGFGAEAERRAGAHEGAGQAVCAAAQCGGGEDRRGPRLSDDRRKTSDDERKVFEQTFKDAPPDQGRGSAKRSDEEAAAAGASGLDGNTQDRLDRGLIAPDARIDLHGMTEDAAIAPCSPSCGARRKREPADAGGDRQGQSRAPKRALDDVAAMAC